MQLQYVDATIPGDGGFDLPINRTYSSPQYFNDDGTNRVFGRRWDMHFGRIKSNYVENLSRNYCTTSALIALNTDDRYNPVFQAADGSSHKIYAANPDDTGASDGITKARHRVTCNDDGTVLIEDRNGLKYYFGKQDYYRQGNGLQYAESFINNDWLVEYDNYLYVTRIEDPHGNYYNINYSQRFNADGEFNTNVFTIDSVEGSSGNDAIFTYKPSPGSPVASDPSFANRSPNLVLHSLQAGGRTVTYDFEELFAGAVSVDNNLISVSMSAGSSTGSTGEKWDYSYHSPAEFIPDSFFLSANSGALATVSSRFGGTTNYEYQFIQSTTVEPLADIKAIKTKTSEGLGTWTYNFNPGADGYNRTTVSGPEGIVSEFTHCNLSLDASDCNGKGGYIVEQKTTGPSAEETVVYQWGISQAISPQNTVFQRYGGFNVNYTISTHIVRLTQSVVSRGNDYLATIYSNYDEFENAQVVGERRTAEYVHLTSTGILLDSTDLDTRLTYNNYVNKTGSDLWLLGLPIRSRVEEPIGVASNPINLETDQVMAYTYTDEGKVETESRYGSVTQYFYDRAGNVDLMIDPNGNRFKFEDYVLGVAQTEKRSVALAGAEQLFLTRVVDEKTGRVISQTVIRELGTGESYTTTIGYDDLGRVERVSRPTGSDTEVTYLNTSTRTTRGPLTKVNEYDGFGRMTSATSSGADFNYTATSDYDAYGRVTERAALYKSGESLFRSFYEYDGLGRVLSETNNVDSFSKNYSYDGLKTVVTDRKGQETTFQHRGFSSFSDTQLISITQVVGGGEPDIVTSITPTKTGLPRVITQGESFRQFAYDGRYRVVELARPETFNATFSYDENGNVKGRSLVSINVEYEYDGRNNVVGIDFTKLTFVPGFSFGTVLDTLSSEYLAEDVTFKYNHDNTVRQSANSDSIWNYSYDGNGNLLSENLNLLGDVSKSFTIEHKYDGNDNQSEIVYPSGKVVSIAPDALGRPTMLGEFLKDIEYESTNTVASATYGNGKVWSMTQNSNKLVDSNSVSDIVTETYDYDANFNIDEVDSSISGLRTYDFDGINRLNRMRMGTGDWESYSYDVNSNITSNAFPEVQGRSYNFTDIEYNSVTQLPTTGVGFKKDGSDVPFGTNINHDIQGNINRFGDYEYLFDGAGYLRAVKQNFVVQAEYDYDANGLRTVVAKDGETIVTVYGVNGDLLHEYHVQKKMQSDFVYLNNYLVARYDTNRVWSLEEDADQDGLPNVFDLDDDNDGKSDLAEIACGSDPLDASDVGSDADNDGILDCNDDIIDSDFDGVADVDDLFPNDSGESADADLDGIGDIADLDDDNDGQSDLHELECNSDPFDGSSLAIDVDSDGVPDCTQVESDKGSVYVWGGWPTPELISDVPVGENFVQVALADTTSIGLKSDGSLVAWGADVHILISDLPSGNDFIAIYADGDAAVALKSDGSLEVWGDASDSLIEAALLSSDLTFVDFSFNAGFRAYSLGLRDDGGITVLGSTGDEWYEDLPTGLGHKAIAVGLVRAVAIKPDGSLVQWGGYLRGERASSVPAGNDFVAVASGDYHSAALRADGSIVSWGTGGDDVISESPKGNDFVTIKANNSTFVALRDDGSYVTWGFTGTVGSGPNSSGLVDIDVGRYHIAAICTVTTSLDCVDEQLDTDLDGIVDNLDNDDDNDGLEDKDELTCGSDPKDISSLSVDTDRDGRPDCVDIFPLDSAESIDTDGDGIGDNADIDDDNDGQTDSYEAFCNTDPKDASSFGRDSDNDGIADCIDEDTELLVYEGEIYRFSGLKPPLEDFSPSNFPLTNYDDSIDFMGSSPTGKDFIQTVSARRASIALKSDGSLVVWGTEYYSEKYGYDLSELYEPPLGNDYVAVSAYGQTAAAWKTDGSIVTWGSDYSGLVSGTPFGNDFVDVQVGGIFIVALQTDGSLVAWGNDRDGLISNLPTASNFTAIAAGNDHAIALTADGRLVSWGEDYFGLVDDTPSDSDYVAVAAGDRHSLVLKSDGTLLAWEDNGLEDNSLEVINTPTNTGYIGIVAGGSTSIAYRADGSLESWGDFNDILTQDKKLRSVSVSSSHVTAIRTDSQGTEEPGLDSDGDGMPNNIDLDDDNDGVEDALDAFPLDDSESIDTDSDGVGNNADSDDDNDGVEDNLDAFAL